MLFGTCRFDSKCQKKLQMANVDETLQRRQAVFKPFLEMVRPGCTRPAPHNLLDVAELWPIPQSQNSPNLTCAVSPSRTISHLNSIRKPLYSSTMLRSQPARNAICALSWRQPATSQSSRCFSTSTSLAAISPHRKPTSPLTTSAQNDSARRGQSTAAAPAPSVYSQPRQWLHPRISSADQPTQTSTACSQSSIQPRIEAK